MTRSKRRLALTLAALQCALCLFWCAIPSPTSAQSAGGDRRKPQHEVAAKSEFATVAADDASVRKALAASDLAGARRLKGKEGAFEGKVVAVFAPDSYGLVILNFDERYQNALSAVVFASRFSKFPDLEKLKGKRVLISGKFDEYKGRPQIELIDPSQVRVIK